MRYDKIICSTFDLDDKKPKALKKIIERSLDLLLAKHGTMKIFASRRGYHIKIFWKEPIDIYEDLAIRTAIGDSNERLFTEERRLKWFEDKSIFEDSFGYMGYFKLYSDGRIGSEELLFQIEL